MTVPPDIGEPWQDSPADLARLAALDREVRAARAAGITSADFASTRPCGSVLDDLSAKVERGKVLGAQRVRNLLAHATHFILDEEAGRRVVETVEQHAPLIRELRQFAIMPFPVMTVSMPTRALQDADRESLFLVEERNGFKTFAMVLRDTRTGDLVPVPGWYGYADDAKDDNSRIVFRTDGPPMPDDVVHRRMVGTYSMALDAILLFLNSKRGVHISQPTAKRRSLRGGRPVTYFARSTITLTLDNPAEIRRALSTGAHASPRRHGVRGHFFHRGGNPACTHRWAKLDGFEQAWQCVDCERRRFWRRDFERGDETKGVTVARYHVKGQDR